MWPGRAASVVRSESWGTSMVPSCQEGSVCQCGRLWAEWETSLPGFWLVAALSLLHKHLWPLSFFSRKAISCGVDDRAWLVGRILQSPVRTVPLGVLAQLAVNLKTMNQRPTSFEVQRGWVGYWAELRFQPNTEGARMFSDPSRFGLASREVRHFHHGSQQRSHWFALVALPGFHLFIYICLYDKEILPPFNFK